MKITCLLATAAILAAPFSLAVAKDAALAKAIAAPHRSPDFVERDKARKPQEELEFFGIKPTLTVVEIAPGGGYWTEILAPYLQEKGTYYTAMSPKAAETFQKKLDGKPEVYGKVKITSMTEVAPAGTADLVLTFRNVHNWAADGSAEAMFKSFFAVLKPGGVLGVEDHRADAGKKLDDVVNSGYLPTDYVIKLATDAGFKLDAQSEINANPKDDHNHPKGVWTLPPTFDMGETDKAKWQAIGESDRMTLRFVKPATAK